MHPIPSLTKDDIASLCCTKALKEASGVRDHVIHTQYRTSLQVFLYVIAKLSNSVDSELSGIRYYYESYSNSRSGLCVLFLVINS